MEGRNLKTKIYRESDILRKNNENTWDLNLILKFWVVFKFWIFLWSSRDICFIFCSIEVPTMIHLISLYCTAEIQGKYQIREVRNFKVLEKTDYWWIQQNSSWLFQLQEFYDREKLNLGFGLDGVTTSLSDALFYANEKGRVADDILDWVLKINQWCLKPTTNNSIISYGVNKFFCDLNFYTRME